VPLVNLKSIFPDPKNVSWAVGAFNVHNMEFIRAVMEAAELERAPVMLAVASVSIEYIGLELLGIAALDAARRATVPVAVHLDHARELDLVKRALDLGFSSVMFDGSALSFEENKDKTCEMVEMAKDFNASTEGEVGIMSHADLGGTAVQTDPDQAVRFAQETGVDLLAVSVGSVHGMRSQGARLNLDLLKTLEKALPCPTVLHGSSGIVDEDITRAVRVGVGKVNIGTGIKVAFAKGIRETLAKDGETDALKFLRIGTDRGREFVRNKIRLLGSDGKA
jgi:fructose-bisphosphate aldolase, class II